MRYYSKRLTVHYYPGHWIQYQSCTHSAPSQLPGEHSGYVLLQGRTHATSCNKITFASYRVPIYTPGWRAAMRIKCLAEGQKVPGIDGNRTPRPFDPESGSKIHKTTKIHVISYIPCIQTLTLLRLKRYVR